MTIRVGILGAGALATAYGGVLRKQYGVKLTAVVDQDQAQAEALARKTMSRPYGHVDESLPRIDVAYIFADVAQRVDQIRALAGAGKAIFCHAPLAATVEEGEEIADIVDQAGIPFMMHFPQRQRVPFHHLQEAVDVVSTRRLIELFSVRLGLPTDAEKEQVEASSAPGGLVLSSVVHDVDLLRWLSGFDDLIAVHGEVSAAQAERPDWFDTVSATLRFSKGAIGLLHVSWTSHVETHQHGIVGTAGTMVAEGRRMWEIDRLRHRTPERQTEQVAAYTHDTTKALGYKETSRAFVIALREKDEKMPITLDDGLQALRVCQEILRTSSPPAAPLDPA